MSKQLLHSHGTGVVIAALNHRTFAVVSTSLSASSQNAIVYELMASPNSSSAGGGEEDKPGEKGNNDDNEIQAVFCTEIGSSLWFAVSRAEKTLSLYSISAEIVEKNNTRDSSEEDVTKTLYPCKIYSLSKRARCLAFTNVDECQVIIAGDLSGDATAFPVPEDASPSASSPKDAEAVKPTSTPKRLLLGHTASMLTGLNVVKKNSDQQQQFILTSDRDEKVRVSNFPETHIIQGYLLGHSSFISCMDAISNERSLCLTASGDGTSRLWDYKTCKEVGMLPVVVKKSSETKQDDNEEVDEEVESINEMENMVDEEESNDNGDIEGDYEDEDGDDYEEDSFDRHEVAVPLSAALHPDATYAAVARDEIQSIDIHPIPPVQAKSSSSTSLQLSHLVSLHKKQTLECKSQPLAIRFASDSLLALAREPEYLLHFTKTEDGFHDISRSSCLSNALRRVAQAEHITMPVTTLERGNDGGWAAQKKEDRKELTMKSSERGGLHWNDPERKETAKLAQQRKRQRKRARRKEEGEQVN